MSADGFASKMTVDVNDLIRLIDKTRFAISAEETRYYLNGLYVHTVIDRRLRAPAPPWPRTARAWPWPTCPRPRARPARPGVIVPRKTIGEIRRLLEDAGENVDLQISPRRCGWSWAARP